MSNFRRRTVWVLTVICWFSAWSEGRVALREEPPYALPMPDQVPFRLFRDYLIVVEGNLGSLSRRCMLIDTGASPTIIDRSVAKHLGLASGPARLSQVNGDKTVGMTVLPSLWLGPIHATALPAFVADLSFLQWQLGLHIDAIVGLDVLGTRNFAIDYESKQIIFGQLPISGDWAPFESAPPLVTVKMQVAGKPMKLLVDTGASGLMLFHEDDIGLGPSTWKRNLVNLSGSFSGEQVEVSLNLGRTSRRSQTAYLVQSQEKLPQHIDGLMSIRAMGIKELMFDFDRQVLSWK